MNLIAILIAITQTLSAVIFFASAYLLRRAQGQKNLPAFFNYWSGALFLLGLSAYLEAIAFFTPPQTMQIAGTVFLLPRFFYLLSLVTLFGALNLFISFHLQQGTSDFLALLHGLNWVWGLVILIFILTQLPQFPSTTQVLLLPRGGALLLAVYVFLFSLFNSGAFFAAAYDHPAVRVALRGFLLGTGPSLYIIAQVGAAIFPNFFYLWISEIMALSGSLLLLSGLLLHVDFEQ